MKVVYSTSLSQEKTYSKVKTFSEEMKRKFDGKFTLTGETWNDDKKTAVITGKAMGISATFTILVKDKLVYIQADNFLLNAFESIIKPKIIEALDQCFN